MSETDQPPTIEDFDRLDLRVGEIVEILDFPRARKPAYKLTIDFGPLGVRHSSAQLPALYSKDDLLHRQVVCVANFAPRNIAGFQSEVLVLGVPDTQGNVVLLQPDRVVPLGGRVF
ncbi:MAG: tRNA-binding protein [Chloroflexota bacterium]